MCALRLTFRILLTMSLFLCGTALVFGQTNFGFVNNITAVPVPGVGHDYLHDLDEIVNPANGSLSIRIEAPRPKERGLNYPIYAFMYDSTQQFAVQFYQQGNGQTYSCGQDSAGDGPTGGPPQPLNCVISVSFFNQSISWPGGANGVLSGPNSMISSYVEYSRYYNATYMTCYITQGFSYEDPYGVIHDLGAYQNNNGTNNSGCSYLGIQDNPVGGDEEYKIALYDTYTSPSLSKSYMIDTHGNSVQVSAPGIIQSPTLEDTNGNAVNGSGRSGTYQSFQPWGDALAYPKTASRTFAGGATYNYTWGTATTQFTPSSVDLTKLQIGYDNLCVAPALGPSGSTTNPVVVQMQEPDGLYYSFSYDPTYGLLNKITYPTGAWVQYTWGVNSLSDATGYTTPAQGVNNFNDPVFIPGGTTMNTSCIFEHDTPAILKRIVSYDGTHQALEQDFSYSTVWQTGNTGIWTSKQTTMTTKDLLLPGTPSFTTVYTYSPYMPFKAIGSHLVSSQIPLENTTVYNDTAGNILRTVTKTWNYNNQLAGECTTLPNGMTSGTFYQYQSYPLGGSWVQSNPTGLTTNLRADIAEYDYGLVATPCQQPSTTPTRETVTTYSNFSNTPLWPSFTYVSAAVSMPPMLDRPATVITYQNGAKVAETDYSYDQTVVASVSPTPIGHDETNYGNGLAVPRGNLTTANRKCFQGSTSCTNSVTTIAYDTTGQPISVTDANNNQTTLSYADNYTNDDGSPSGNTNTYVTRITRPSTNGVSHIEYFQWDFNKGELRTLTDENNNQTSYQYLDPLWRLTKASFPDGGSVTKTYQDAGPNPTVTTSTAINSTTTLTTTTVMDGVGHITQKQLNSDPDGTTYTVTTYNGLGSPYQVYNPTRCNPPTTNCGESTWGATTNFYDALGRTCLVVPPDGSLPSGGTCPSTQPSNTIFTIYSGNTTTVTDQAGKSRKSVADALGRLTQVFEDPAGLNYETDYTYDALDNLLTVSQKGGTTDSTQWRPRTFVYDSLSRLTSATNPESGTVRYVYDANGNVTSKTSPGPNQDGFPGTGSATVSGSEQSIPGGGATSGTGSVTFSGTLQSKQVQTQTAAPGTGSVTLSGTLESKQVQTQAATHATGYVIISGYEQSEYYQPPCESDMPSCPDPILIYDSGTVTISVNGHPDSYDYYQNDGSNTIATGLANAINADSAASVTASASGSTVYLTSKGTGTGANLSLISGSTYSPDFAGPSFTTTNSGTTLTGGANAVYNTIYDSGTCTITVNSHPGDATSYSGSGTTSSSIASALGSVINGDSGAVVNASVSGSTVNLTAKLAASTTNYPLSSSCSYDTSDFPSPSFSTSNSGSTLTGGKDAVYNTIYDSGTSTITITVNGTPHSDTYSWSGSGTTSSSIASGLAANINADSAASVSATPSGSTVNLTAKTTGASTNYSLSSSWTYDSTDFSSAAFTSNSGSTLTGGHDAGPTTYDSGSVWITINNTQYSVSYGQSSSYASVASALASAISAGSLANASASSTTNPPSATVSITAKTNGSATNYSWSSGSSTSQSGPFPSPSFSVSVSGPSLTGGTDPGGTTVTANFLYDALNRLTQKSFSDGATPTVKYGYDAVALSACTVAPPALTDAYPVGRRTAMCDGAGAESWSHDTRGRVLNDSRSTNGVTMTYAYAPYLDGSINTITYPSGRVITYTLKNSGANTASRPLSAVDTANSINYATAASYAPTGALSSLTNGVNTISTLYYNSRLQPCRISVKTSGTPPTNCADLNNKGNVLDFTFGFNLGSADNGNVAFVNNNKDNTRSQNFTYDPLNRLATAQTQTSGVTIPNSNCWGLTFGYNPWGNLLSSTISGPSGCGEPLPFSLYATNNNQLSLSATQLTGYCYDAAGNLALNAACPTGSFTPTYSYNAENQMTSTAGFTYSYDGDGRRVMKSSGTLYWYGLSSDPLDETDLAGNTNNSSFFEYVFFNGQRIARRDYQNNINYYFSDHLGSSRVVTNSSGTILDDSDFYPFGGERPVTTSSGNHYKFTGKERDSESGLDYFGARYYSSTLGPFLSPDRYNSIIIRQGMKAGGLPEAAVDNFFNGFLENPQNWNEYNYALNNPPRFIDPTGAAPQDGHHLLVARDTLFRAGTLARDFAESIKTGPLSGNGYPNQPGFNELHQEYNEAVKEMLNDEVTKLGPAEGWSLPQWKDFANSVLNSTEPAIKDFLDELEQNNPGARAALASSIATYRVSTPVLARIIASALARSLFRILILCVNCDEASQRKLRERVTHHIGPPRPVY